MYGLGLVGQGCFLGWIRRFSDCMHLDEHHRNKLALSGVRRSVSLASKYQGRSDKPALDGASHRRFFSRPYVYNRLFDSPIVDVVVTGTRYDLSIQPPAGTYHWQVRVDAGDFSSPWSDPSRFVTEEPLLAARGLAATTPSVSKIPWFASHGILKPVKDTKMLCLSCRRDRGPHAWDQAHAIGKTSCAHEFGHDILAVVATINHYYGGTAKQDQLSYLMMGAADYGNKVEPESDLGHSLIFDHDEVSTLLQKALGGAEILAIDAGDGLIISLAIKNSLAPVIGFTAGKSDPKTTIHPKLIWGVENRPDPKDPGGIPITRVIFYDPLVGKVPITEPVSSIKIAYSPLVVAGAPKNPPLLVDPGMLSDGDGDGIVDFDEVRRFSTSDIRKDTDGDGVEDKTEIWSAAFGEGLNRHEPDSDGDGMRCETDEDSDNDKCKDGDEDRNRNGRFALSMPLVGAYFKEPGETNPWKKDEFKLELTAGRQKIGFNRCTDLTVRLTDGDQEPVADVIVALEREPDEMGYFCDEEGCFDSVLQKTDDQGTCIIPFCAKGPPGTTTVPGTAIIKAIFEQCDSGPKIEKEIQIQIFPVEWVFAIQDEAVLTGGEKFWDLGITAGAKRVSNFKIRYKDAGYQTLKGRFHHPETSEPGLYIDSISTQSLGNFQLFVDGKLVDGTWVRSAPTDEPKLWEIVLSDDTAASDYRRIPRYLELRTTAGYTVRTPLVWWLVCQTSGSRVRDYYRSTDPDTGRPTWCVKSWDYLSSGANFFFGDGNAEGADPLWQEWAAGKEQSGVSFIPVGTVAGYPVRHLEVSGTMPQYVSCDLTKDADSPVVIRQVFPKEKHWCSLMPPFSWTMTQRDDQPGRSMQDLLRDELAVEGPMEPPPLLDDIQFKRDYIGNELKEVQKRDLTPPRYTVRMRLGTGPGP